MSKPEQTETRCNLHTPYGYSYPGTAAVSGDDAGTLLTDGAQDPYAFFTVENDETQAADWYGSKRVLPLFHEGKEPHFYIQNDFGFVSELHRVELSFGQEKGAVLPVHAEVFCSDDGYNFHTYPEQKLSREDGLFRIVFSRPVQAKAVKVFVYTPLHTKIAISELAVFGIPSPHKRMLLSQGAACVWKGRPLPGFEQADAAWLTEKSDAEQEKTVGMAPSFEDPCTKSQISEISVDLGGMFAVSDVGFVARTEAIPSYITVRWSADGVQFFDLGQSFAREQWGHGALQSTRFCVMRNHTVSARYLRVEIQGPAILSKLEVYGSETPVPEPEYAFLASAKGEKNRRYQGGFIQLICLEEPLENAIIKASDYMWYLLLKGMKELGMNDVILQYGADFTNKRTAFHAKRLLQKGYRMSEGMGCADPYAAIFRAAEKLSMQVYVGTVTTYGCLQSILDHGGMAHVAELLPDQEDVIRDIHDTFGASPAFAGYYMADEACDCWLCQEEGFPIYRALYLAQSKWAKALDPDKKILISPAIWRSGTPEEGARRLADLIAPEQEGGAPIVDVVAAQDCLGRDEHLAVTDETYRDYEAHVRAWASAARAAGVDFWSDAEAFEITSHPKRWKDHLRTLELETALTDNIVLFDVPHYFSELFHGPLHSWMRFDLSSIDAHYVKHIQIG